MSLILPQREKRGVKVKGKQKKREQIALSFLCKKFSESFVKPGDMPLPALCFLLKKFLHCIDIGFHVFGGIVKSCLFIFREV